MNKDITLREVQALVDQYRLSCLWDIEQERMVCDYNTLINNKAMVLQIHQNLWSKCQQAFMEHKINPRISGDFFYNLGTAPEKSTSGIV